MATRTHAYGEAAAVVRWRAELLRESGFPEPLASVAASDERIDVHALIGLADCGCPPYLAVRILAPLDDRGGR